MAEESYPFTGSDCATELQWSRMARNWQIDGVIATSAAGTDLKVSGNSTSNVSVAAGSAFVNGFFYRSSSSKSLAVPTNVGSANPRIDAVVLRCSQTSGDVTSQYITGGSVAPTLASDPDDVFDIPLAYVTVAAGASTVAGSAVQDLRYFTGLPAAIGQSGNRRPHREGQLLFEGGRLLVSTGSTWKTVQLGDMPRVQAYQSGTGQVLTSGVGADLAFTVDVYDVGAMHATSGDPAYKRFYCVADGYYRVSAGATFNADGTGFRSLTIVKNGTSGSTGGTAIGRATQLSASASQETSMSVIAPATALVVGDYLTLRAYQNSGGLLDMNTGPDRTWFDMEWIRD